MDFMTCIGCFVEGQFLFGACWAATKALADRILCRPALNQPPIASLHFYGRSLSILIFKFDLITTLDKQWRKSFKNILQHAFSTTLFACYLKAAFRERTYDFELFLASF